MLPVHTILFPTDLSESANRVFPLACSVARDCGARVIVLYVMPAPLGPDVIEARHRPDEYFAGARHALDSIQPPDQNVRVEHRLEEGDAAKIIVETAGEVQAGLICMATHGRTGPGRLLFGSIAEEVLRKAPCAVLTAKVPAPPEARTGAPEHTESRTASTAAWPLKTILHPTDFSRHSAAALQFAGALARDHRARLIVVHVTSVPDLAYQGYGVPGSALQEGEYLTRVREDLEKLEAGPDVSFERRLEEGDPAIEILRVAADVRADLIVVGSHGRTGLRHLLTGSVAEQIERNALCPVLTVKTPFA